MNEQTPALVPTPLLDAFALDRAVAGLLERALASTPLSATEYGLYSVIAGDPACTTTSIAATLSVPLTTASDWVQAAIARGHVERARDDNDHRRFVLALSDGGRSAFAESQAGFSVAYEAFLRHVTLSEAAMRAALQEMVRATQAAAADLNT